MNIQDQTVWINTYRAEIGVDDDDNWGLCPINISSAGFKHCWNLHGKHTHIHIYIYIYIYIHIPCIGLNKHVTDGTWKKLKPKECILTCGLFAGMGYVFLYCSIFWRGTPASLNNQQGFWIQSFPKISMEGELIFGYFWMVGVVNWM